MITLVIIVIVIIIIPPVLANAVRTESSDAANIKRVVCAHTLSLEAVLLAVPVAAEVGVALAGQLDNGVADGIASPGDVIPVEADVGAGEVEEGSKSESDVGIHDGGGGDYLWW